MVSSVWRCFEMFQVPKSVAMETWQDCGAAVRLSEVAPFRKMLKQSIEAIDLGWLLVMWIFGGKYLRVNVLTQFLSCFISVHIHVSHPGGGTRQGAEKNAAEADEAVQLCWETRAIGPNPYFRIKNVKQLWMDGVYNEHTFQQKWNISYLFIIL